MPKTTLRTIKYADFVAMVEETTKTLEKSPDADALALLQSNIEAVKDQAAGKTLKADDLVAIQVIAKVDVEARISALEAKVADLAAKISSAASAGEGKKGGKEKDGTEKGAAQEVALEALSALIARVNTVKVMVEAGTFSKDEFQKAFDGWWTIQNAIETYGTIAATAKAEAAKAEAEKGKTPDEKKAAADAKAAEDKKKKDAEEKAAYEKMSAEEKKAFDEKKAAEKAAAEKAALEKSTPKPWDKDLAGPRRTPTQMFAASRREPPKARQ